MLLSKKEFEQKTLDELMGVQFQYPSTNDPDFQEKIYKKREFYYYKSDEKPDVQNPEEIQKYRNHICTRSFTPYEHQALLSNFINPDTPYRGLLIFHGTGVGKTCTAILIAEKFKPLIQRYNTRIVILVPGPAIKTKWYDQIIKCTDYTYLTKEDQNDPKKIKQCYATIKQFYRIMSYSSFVKKVLGDKVKEHIEGKVIYKKTKEGEHLREEISTLNAIYNLNNTLLIVDEAHQLTGNERGYALSHIIKKSTNLKVVLLSATPMKNLAEDMIELINFVRPPNHPMEKNKIFTANGEFKEKALEYIQQMTSGYISFIRGLDPLIYAKQEHMGEIPKHLIFTKIIPSIMMPFQEKLYQHEIKKMDDTLYKKSESLSNFVFPVINMPKFLQLLTLVVPARYFIDILF